MITDDELTVFMDYLFKAYRVREVKKIKIINHKYDGCTTTLYMESGRNVICRLEYQTDNDVIAWIKERYDIVDTQTYACNAETTLTIMAVQEK